METQTETRSNASMQLMDSLRQKTQDCHTRIESRLDFSVHFASLPHYRRFLERYYGFYQPFETYLAAPERIADWASLEIDFAVRRKTRWLQNDLGALGLTTEQILEIPLCPFGDFPHPASPGELLGCAYVLEGATLGGKVIGRHIERVLGLPVGAPGATFFGGYGAETGMLWKRFRHAAEVFAQRQAAARPGGGDPTVYQAVEWARQTFVALENHVFSAAL